MRVCFLLSEIFSWGKYGGYGSIARHTAGGLAERGIDTVAIVPLRRGQKKVEMLDGVKVFGVPGWALFSPSIYRQVDADIYHSQEASVLTSTALKAMPKRAHILSSIDPWNIDDWRLEFSYDFRSSPKRVLIYPLLWLFYRSPFIKRTASQMKKVYCQAKYLIPKTQSYFSLAERPGFLPNPYRIPNSPPAKAKKPTVCYLARWDSRKRPEIFFELAKLFPNIRFIAMGKAHDPKIDRQLREKYGDIPNVEMTGFIHSFQSSKIKEILDKSWIMVNTAAREGLPAAYVEAASHSCAILSSVDSDGFASRCGFHVKNNKGRNLPQELGGVHTTVEDYAEGLEWLLSDDHWRHKGQAGYAYSSKVHEHTKVIDEHIAIYNNLIGS